MVALTGGNETHNAAPCDERERTRDGNQGSMPNAECPMLNVEH